MPHSDNPQAQQGAQPQRSAEDMQMVKVHLDQQRMYRAHDADRDAVTVGPGDVEVPAWVASEWGMEGEPVHAQRSGKAAKTAEAQLEAETGHDVEQTGTNPPTYVETDKPAPQQDAPKGKK